jgi:Neuraminidase (sialidase)
MPLYAEALDGKNTAYGAAGVSDDGGKTWGKPVDIDNAGNRLDAETDVIELADGRLWAIQRSSGSPACFSVSDNCGDTWMRSQPLNFVAHSPYLLRVKPDNLVVLGYRGYRMLKGSSTGFTALCYSRDECKTWGDAVVVDDVVGAYPSMVQLRDGSVLIVYYDEGSPSSIRAKRFRASQSGIEWLQP